MVTAKLTKSSLFKVIVCALLIAATLSIIGVAQKGKAANEPVSVWLTTPDLTKALTPQSGVSFAPDNGSPDFTINVGDAVTYQQMTGFGASFTDASAWLAYNKLSTSQRSTMMSNLFDPVNGIGLNFLRQPMGASDFSVNGPYSYDDMPAGQTDPNLTNFSIGHDNAYIIPVLKQAQQINPGLKIMANPWSPPGWMKQNNSMIGGNLNNTYMANLASYFVKYIQAYQAQGLPIFAITPQNEPLYNTPNYAGMFMTSADETTFIKSYLGPALASANLSNVKILGWDHNFGTLDYPTTILSDPTANSYTAGIAWHCYSSDPGTSMSTIHDQFPTKEMYQTECSSGPGVSPYDQRTADLIIDDARNWSKTVVGWNIALDTNFGPHSGGCTSCTGMATIDQATGNTTYTLEYYEMGQASKFVAPGAYRIASNTFDNLRDVAFKNPDGSIVLLVHNSNAGGQTFKISWGGQSFMYTLPGGAVATYKWNNTGAPQQPAPTATSVSPSTPTTGPSPVGSSVSQATASNNAYNYLKSHINANGWVPSFLNEPNANNVCFTYDEAVTADAFLVKGDVTAAKGILNVLQSIQTPAGSWYTGYDCTSKNIWEYNQEVGPTIWVALAVEAYEKQTGDKTTYHTMALNAINWSLQFQQPDGGINGGIGGGNVTLTWASTEHNQDAYAALNYYGFPSQATKVKNYLDTVVWDSANNKFCVGRNNCNDPKDPLDVETWGVSSLGANGTHNYAGALTYAFTHHRQTLAFNGVTYDAFGFNNAAYNTDIWFEGTGQMVEALKMVGDTTDANYFLGQEIKNQAADGGIQYSLFGSNNGYWTMSRSEAIAGTSWLVLAIAGFNPFFTPAATSGLPQPTPTTSITHLPTNTPYPPSTPTVGPSPVGSSVSAATASNNAYNYLKSHINANGWVPSFLNDTNNVCFTYDQAVTVDAFLVKGDVTAAKGVLNVLQSIQTPAGSWYTGYDCTTKNIWEYNQEVGPTIWVALAVEAYEKQTGDTTTYHGMAINAVNWSLQFQQPDGGINGGIAAGGPVITWSSTEHNQDAYAALNYYGFPSQATRVKNYLDTVVWDSTNNRFCAGRGACADIKDPMDVDAWGVSALGASGTHNYAAALTYVYTHHRITITANGNTYDAFDFNNTKFVQDIWFEGTGQMVEALKMIGDYTDANYFLGQEIKNQAADGGVQYSLFGSNNGYWTMSKAEGVASTGWLILAAADFNPFFAPHSSVGLQTPTPTASGGGGSTATPTATQLTGATSTPTPTIVGNTVYAINAGGGVAGKFSADNYSNGGGGTATTPNTIDMTGVTNPAPQAVYQSERAGIFAYTFPNLTAGATYTVRLHFAEFYWTKAGQRVFNVAINGATVLPNFDIIAAVGNSNKALVKQFSVAANSNGQIIISFSNGTADQPKVSGIEILSGSGTPPTPTNTTVATATKISTPTPTATTTSGTTPVISINAGGQAAGAYIADTDFNGGGSAVTGNTIDTSGVSGPAPQAVYQSERAGLFTYTIPGLTAGATYTVRLDFAEFYWTKAGQRVFNVAINGATVLPNFDIIAAAGAPNKGVARSIVVTANSSGQIVIAFTGGSADQPKVSGIEILH